MGKKKKKQELSRMLCKEHQMNEELRGKIKSANKAIVYSLKSVPV